MGYRVAPKAFLSGNVLYGPGRYDFGHAEHNWWIKGNTLPDDPAVPAGHTVNVDHNGIEAAYKRTPSRGLRIPDGDDGALDQLTAPVPISASAPWHRAYDICRRIAAEDIYFEAAAKKLIEPISSPLHRYPHYSAATLRCSLDWLKTVDLSGPSIGD